MYILHCMVWLLIWFFSVVTLQLTFVVRIFQKLKILYFWNLKNMYNKGCLTFEKYPMTSLLINPRAIDYIIVNSLSFSLALLHTLWVLRYEYIWWRLFTSRTTKISNWSSKSYLLCCNMFWIDGNLGNALLRDNSTVPRLHSVLLVLLPIIEFSNSSVCHQP